MAKVYKILIITNDKTLREVLGFCFGGWGYEVFFGSYPINNIAGIIKTSPDIIILDIQSAAKGELELCDMLKNDFTTAHTPVITLIDKQHLRQDLLRLRQGVDDYLIKPPDPLDLRIRIEMAVKRSQHSFYANPLTGLPGSLIIEEIIKERIGKKESFVLGHADIDNFKAFNDKYGYLKGDRAIMQTAYMLSTSVRKWGEKGDFVGHIGGDDFIFITGCENYRDVCQNFICMFDTVIPFHYQDDVRKDGFIISKDRTNRLKKVPLMSITMALVIKNNEEELHNIIELNERIAEVKQYLKKIPGSKFMADRRMAKKDDSLTLSVFTNDDSITSFYKPLGQILLDRNVITLSQLDKALRMHWRRGVPLGEVLIDEKIVSDEDLRSALLSQETSARR